MTGVSRKRSTPEKSTISSKRAAISCLRSPRIAPFRNTFSRPVSSGWKPVPTSSRLPTRPTSSAEPVVGSVIRARILSSVLLPAPLRPTMPIASPRATSKRDVAQRPQLFGGGRAAQPAQEAARAGAPRPAGSACRGRRRGSRRRGPSRQTRSAKRRSSRRKIIESARQQQRAGERRAREQRGRRIGAAEQGPAEALDDARHRVQRVDERDPGRAPIQHVRRGVDDRRDEHPELHQERERQPHVPEESVHGGQPERDAERGGDREHARRPAARSRRLRARSLPRRASRAAPRRRARNRPARPAPARSARPAAGSRPSSPAPGSPPRSRFPPSRRARRAARAPARRRSRPRRRRPRRRASGRSRAALRTAP